MLDGMFAAFSSALPSEWTSSTLNMLVVDAVLFTTEALFENETAVKGKIVLISRLAVRKAGFKSWVEPVKGASAIGAVGVIVINTDDALIELANNVGYNADIPVLLIKSSDAAHLHEHGSAALIQGARLGCRRAPESKIGAPVWSQGGQLFISY